MTNAWHKKFSQMFGVSPRMTLPPSQVDEYAIANHKGSAEVMLCFRSGEMATGLTFPAEKIDDLCKALMDSARKAKGVEQ